MTRSLLWALVVAIALAPTAAASPSLVATDLVAEGDIAVDADLAALYLQAMQDGATWEVTAADAVLDRLWSDYRGVLHPANAEAYLAYSASPWQEDRIEYGPASFVSTTTLEAGALLVLANMADVHAASATRVETIAMTDPEIGTTPEADARIGSPDPVVPEVATRLPGEYLNLTFSSGIFTITGDLDLVMYGPSYTVEADGASVEWHTGHRVTSSAAAYQEGTEERHVLRLKDAVLQIRSREPASLFARHPTLTVDGGLSAGSAEGSLQLGPDGIVRSYAGEPLEYAGVVALALSPASGRISMTSPDLGLATAAIAPQGPPLLALTAGAVLALAAVAGAVAAFARRRLRGDEMDVALAAMAEHRWEDALPPLTRLARHEPANAHVLVDRALCLEQVGRFEDAARGFEAALRAAPRHAEAHFYYARTLAKMREREAARAHLEEALERDPRLVEMVRAENVLKGL